MAPEVIAGEKYGPSADVYSYSIVMWEIAAQAEPWPDVQGSFITNKLLQRLRAGERPVVEAGWPEQFVVVMQQCWAGEPAARPLFPTVMTSVSQYSEAAASLSL